jgi:magnesium-transporting ATPase (P-type)
VLTTSPLRVIQLLWVNLIMDSFASVALATEDPNRVPGLKQQLLNRKPYPRSQALLSKIMIRNMFAHAVWQLVILFVLVFAVGDVCEAGESTDVCGGIVYKDFLTSVRSGRPVDFDSMYLPEDVKCIGAFDQGKDKTFWQVSSMPIDASGHAFTGYIPARPHEYCHEAHGCGTRSQHFTIIFNTFVWLQVFNEINARKIHNEKNQFQGFLYNNMFLLIMAITTALQVRADLQVCFLEHCLLQKLNQTRPVVEMSLHKHQLSKLTCPCQGSLQACTHVHVQHYTNVSECRQVEF